MSNLPEYELVTGAGERRKVNFRRRADSTRIVREEFRYADGEWEPTGTETLREFRVNGEPRSPIPLTPVDER